MSFEYELAMKSHCVMTEPVAYVTNISRVNNLFLKCAGSIHLLKRQ